MSDRILEYLKPDIPYPSYRARVDHVNAVEMTCDVTLIIDDSTVEGVRLNANLNPESGLIQLPLVDSIVIISFLDHSLAYVTQYSLIDSYDLKIEQVNFQINKQGYLIQKGDDSLKELMTDLINLLKNLKVNTSQGPSTIPLTDTQTSLDQVQAKIDNLLK